MPSPKPTPRYIEVPFAFAPENLLKSYYIKPRDYKRIFPKPIFFERGLLIIRDEYIIVGAVGENLDFLKVREKYKLEKNGRSFHVEVRRKTQCGADARTFVLLKEIAGEDLSGIATITDKLNVFPLTGDITIDVSSVGQIHPGPVGGQGSSEGYPNVYGITRPVLPIRLLPTFNRLNLQQFTKSEVGFKATIPREEKGLKIKVAVLDTGLRYAPDPQKISYKRRSCGNHHTGWNFVKDTSDVEDRHPELHGTRISAIIKQQYPLAEIIPIKTAQDTGACELYDVLCGLEYARINGARVVNASFSFKANPEQDVPLLRTMLEALKQDDIWLVAAAGNASQYPVDALGNTPPLGQNAPLNLPACYSQDDDKNHVVTVTTVRRSRSTKSRLSTLKVGECYSNEFVDIGVVGNGTPSGDPETDGLTFAAPGFTEARPGTSYATAFVTGKMARFLVESGASTKEQLLTVLGSVVNDELINGIRDGRYIEVNVRVNVAA